MVRQAMVIVSPMLGARHWPDLQASKLYDPAFSNRFRQGTHHQKDRI
jgi:precorrin-4/cobalt-precorrin-4 C11-methyltransferase